MPDDLMVDQRLAAARIATLFKVARPAYLATIANAALLLLVLWGTLPAAPLLGWSGLVVVLRRRDYRIQKRHYGTDFDEED